MKAYDIKELLKKLESKGLALGEEAAKIFIASLVDWLEESAVISPNKIDDVAALGLPQLEKLALSLADKIDPSNSPAPSA